MSFEVDVTNANRKTQASIRLAEIAPKKLFARFGTEIVKRAKINTTRGILGGRAFRRTSQLSRNIGMKIAAAGGIFELTVGTGIGTAKTVRYGSVHEFGMTIKAKRAKYLVFRTADGAWHMVKQVVIPARHWLRRSIQEAEWMMNERELAKEAGFPESMNWE